MLEQFVPFRLCSSQPSAKCSNTVCHQRRWRFTPRHNPQPRRVYHFNGMSNMPICYVRESTSANGICLSDECEDPALVRANTFTGLPIFRFRNIPIKEKAIPKLGLFPVQEIWRKELHALTECVVAPILEDLGMSNELSKIIEYHPYPISRPITSWKCSKIISAQNRSCIFPSRERLKTPKFSPVPMRYDENLSCDDILTEDFESQVFALLGQILQSRDIESIKRWLATASDREKASVMSILRTAFESKMKGEPLLEEKKEFDVRLNGDEERSSSTPVQDEYSDEVDRLLIHTRQGSRSQSVRPKTSFSRIRPQTSTSCVTHQGSLGSTNSRQSTPVYLRYRTSQKTTAIQTEDNLDQDFSPKDETQ